MKITIHTGSSKELPIFLSSTPNCKNQGIKYKGSVKVREKYREIEKWNFVATMAHVFLKDVHNQYTKADNPKPYSKIGSIQFEVFVLVYLTRTII